MFKVVRQFWPWMASLLLHGLFISTAAYFSSPHPVRQERTLEIILDEPNAVSSREILPARAAPKRNVVKTHAAPLISSTISPKVALPEIESPAAIVPALKETTSLSKNGIVFLLDASESMVVGLDSAKQILRDRLNGLSEKAFINIAYFSKEVVFFSPRPFIWLNKEKEKALAFCQKVTAQGNLEIPDGLREVLKRNPSRIILISDGLVENRDLAYEIIIKARSEGVIIDTVLIRRNPFEEDVLKRAAYLTGGSFSVFHQTF